MPFFEHNLSFWLSDYLKGSRGYPEESIVLNYKVGNFVFDAVIIEENTQKISGIVETKIVSDLSKHKNDTKEYYDQLIRYYDILEEGTIVYLALFDKEGNHKFFIVVRHKLFEEDYYLEMKDFPTYWEVTGSKLTELRKKEINETNENYTYFRRACRIIAGIAFVLFFLSLKDCTIVTGYREYNKICSLHIDYPNLLLFGMGTILLLVSFLRKIKTQRFSIDRSEEDALRKKCGSTSMIATKE